MNTFIRLFKYINCENVRKNKIENNLKLFKDLRKASIIFFKITFFTDYYLFLFIPYISFIGQQVRLAMVPRGYELTSFDIYSTSTDLDDEKTSASTF